ncbi:response regulator [bacterium AH-315-J21]|nr:response regulator [bacterium AH-315-J21]
MKILAVDDSPTMRRIIINTLGRAGFTDIVEAEHGKDALAKMEAEKIDFVITDWNMPEMDGLSFVTNVRSKPEHANIPILMITTRSVKEDIVEALKAGVNNYIVKPFTPDTLKSKIDEILKGA